MFSRHAIIRSTVVLGVLLPSLSVFSDTILIATFSSFFLPGNLGYWLLVAGASLVIIGICCEDISICRKIAMMVLCLSVMGILLALTTVFALYVTGLDGIM